MNAVDSIAPPVEPKRRSGRGRNSDAQASRKSDGQDLRKADKPNKPTPKSLNADLGKLSTYVPNWILKKLTVATAEWDLDKSDIVTQSLERTLAGIVFYDKNKVKKASEPTCDTGDIGEAGAAA